MIKYISYQMFILLFLIQPLASDVFEILKSDQTCVGYKTTKGMFYITDVDVVSMNCNVQFIKSNSSIQVLIPVDKFDSGNFKRDSEVAILLGDSQKIPIRFEIQIPNGVKIDSIPEKILGKLFIKESQKDITLELSKKSGYIRFQVYTKFSTLGVTVDSVGPGGLIAKPKDELILFGQISEKLIFESEN
jgi:hypothetical protein